MTISEAQRLIEEGTPEELARLVERIENEGLHLAGRSNATEWARIEDAARIRLYPDEG